MRREPPATIPTICHTLILDQRRKERLMRELEKRFVMMTADLLTLYDTTNVPTEVFIVLLYTYWCMNAPYKQCLAPVFSPQLSTLRVKAIL